MPREQMNELINEMPQEAFEQRFLADRGLEGAIFDMDGTLVDSMFVWDAVGEQYLRGRGIEPLPDVREALRPLSLPQAAEYLIAAYGLRESVQEIMDNVNSSIEDFYFREAQLKPGAKEMLENLKKAGVKLCLATATDRWLVDSVLKRTGIQDYFSNIFTCGEVGAGKDQPDIFLKALSALGTRKEKTLVFEDALFAARSVKAAGIPLAVVYDPSAAGQQEELKELAELYIKDWRDFL